MLVVEQGAHGTSYGAWLADEIQRRLFDWLDQPVERVTGAEASPSISRVLEHAAMADVDDEVLVDEEELLDEDEDDEEEDELCTTQIRTLDTSTYPKKLTEDEDEEEVLSEVEVDVDDREVAVDDPEVLVDESVLVGSPCAPMTGKRGKVSSF